MSDAGVVAFGGEQAQTLGRRIRQASGPILPSRASLVQTPSSFTGQTARAPSAVYPLHQDTAMARRTTPFRFPAGAIMGTG
jgi:hypothetical protein